MPDLGLDAFDDGPGSLSPARPATSPDTFTPDSGAPDPVVLDPPQLGPPAYAPGPDPGGPAADPGAPDLDGPIPDGPIPDGPIPDGPIPDGPVPDGPVIDGPVPDGPVPDDVVEAPRADDPSDAPAMDLDGPVPAEPEDISAYSPAIGSPDDPARIDATGPRDIWTPEFIEKLVADDARLGAYLAALDGPVPDDRSDVTPDAVGPDDLTGPALDPLDGPVPVTLSDVTPDPAEDTGPEIDMLDGPVPDDPTDLAPDVAVEPTGPTTDLDGPGLDGPVPDDLSDLTLPATEPAAPDPGDGPVPDSLSDPVPDPAGHTGPRLDTLDGPVPDDPTDLAPDMAVDPTGPTTGLDGPGVDGPGLNGPGRDGPRLDGPGSDGPGPDDLSDLTLPATDPAEPAGPAPDPGDGPAPAEPAQVSAAPDLLPVETTSPAGIIGTPPDMIPGGPATDLPADAVDPAPQAARPDPTEFAVEPADIDPVRPDGTDMPPGPADRVDTPRSAAPDVRITAVDPADVGPVTPDNDRPTAVPVGGTDASTTGPSPSGLAPDDHDVIAVPTDPAFENGPSPVLDTPVAQADRSGSPEPADVLADAVPESREPLSVPPVDEAVRPESPAADVVEPVPDAVATIRRDDGVGIPRERDLLPDTGAAEEPDPFPELRLTSSDSEVHPTDAVTGLLPLADRLEDLRAREPQLAAALDGADDFVRKHIAADSPEQIEAYWRAHIARPSVDPADPASFTRYVRHVVQKIERAAAGELNLLFDRAGAGEVPLTMPGRPNEPGIDLITLDPADETIRLFDDKSWNRAVGNVSALQENLLTNLEQALREIDPRACADERRPAVERAIARLTEARDRIAAGREPVRTILASLRILRVVTNTAGATDAAITKRLREAGFVVEDLSPHRAEIGRRQRENPSPELRRALDEAARRRATGDE